MRNGIDQNRVLKRATLTFQTRVVNVNNTLLITPVNNMLLTLLKTCEIQVFYTVNNTFLK